MEKESFEDIEVAHILNNHFIAIKVDREERPDIDHIYMSVCQTLTGSGGWPLTIFMTPDAKPFYAGTYFPKNDRVGIPGLINILQRVNEAWKNNRDALLHSSEEILNAVNKATNAENDVNYVNTANAVNVANNANGVYTAYNKSSGLMKGLYSDAIHEAFSLYKRSFDSQYGGFGRTPKFPTPHNLLFLLRYWYKTQEPTALEMVEKTLDSMYRGGIYDHIGFGFSRYSTDRKWLVPHFEKMLYDNALLAIAYLETYQATYNKKYADIAKEIFTYILRDMTSPEGGFYSAEDADSEGEEGKFYVWSDDEIKKVLGEEDGEKFCAYYNITAQGNFEGKNIPNLITKSSGINTIDTEVTGIGIVNTVAKNTKSINTEPNNTELTNTELINTESINAEFINNKFIKACREKLFKHRKNRIHPYKDDKILTSWNGLMIAAMSIGGRVLKEKQYTSAAEKAVDFIFTKLIREDGRLLARFRDGDASFPAYADDYAFLIWGLIELYETTFKPDYLQKALYLNNELIEYFWDERNGGLFIYGSDSEQLIIRPKEIYDGATPSGNSVSALNFLRLSKLTGQYELEDKTEQLLKAFSSDIKNHPISYAFSLVAAMFAQSSTKEVVIVSDFHDTATDEMLNIIHQGFRPFIVSMLYANEYKSLKSVVPFIIGHKSIDGKPTAYICENFTCQEPVTDIEHLRELLN